MENSRKLRQAAFTLHENEKLLNNLRVQEYYQCKKKKDKIAISRLIADDLIKLSIFRNQEEIHKRLENLKITYHSLKKKEEAYFKIKWQYYDKMKKFLE